MNVQQLRSVYAIVKHDLNLTRAAEHLHATQPGLTKHVQGLEAELGVDLFVRHKKRFIGLTPAGHAILPIAARAVDVFDELRRTARGFANDHADVLTLATSPTQARCFLPAVIQQFSLRYPKTRLHVLQGGVNHSIDLVNHGKANFCISSMPSKANDQMEFFPCYDHQWLLLVPPSHSLLQKRPLTLADIAQHPLITYEEGFSSRALIVDRFHAQGLTPNIVLDAADNDIMKRCVFSGIGIAIIGSAAYDAARDHGLAAIDLAGLIPSTRIHVGIRRDTILNAQALYFLKLFEPKLVSMLDRFINARNVAA
jgi:LysR family cys regulon transcriptional activator